MNGRTETIPPAETKVSRGLLALMAGSSYSHFDAKMQLSDYCSPLTILEIQKRYGAEMLQKIVTVLGYQGRPKRCCEYWKALEGGVWPECRKEKAPNSDQTERGLQNVQD